jgi:hypothetical protein
MMSQFIVLCLPLVNQFMKRPPQKMVSPQRKSRELFSLFAVASSVRTEKVAWSNNAQWSSNVTVKISKEGAQAPACSEAALSALETEVGEWLRDGLIDRFGKGAFTLSQVTGVENGNTISLVASVDCLEIRCLHSLVLYATQKGRMDRREQWRQRLGWMHGRGHAYFERYRRWKEGSIHR